MNKMSESETFKKLNSGGDLVCTKKEGEKQVSFKKPKPGSVFPPKRRSVKGMIFKYVAISICHVFHPYLPSSPEALQSNKAYSCFKKGNTCRYPIFF